ncbi:MAG: N-acetylmuramoyl-L-alanine amidase [Methylocapsa sp.]|nr:N-acetylmuramoyl-L-alanine amidase [Methylocapsa sp.]
MGNHWRPKPCHCAPGEIDLRSPMDDVTVRSGILLPVRAADVAARKLAPAIIGMIGMAFLLSAGVACDARAQAEPAASMAAATSVQLDQSADQATLSFGMSACLEASAFVLGDPARAVIDLPQTDFAKLQEKEIAKPQQRKNSLVASFRFGQLEPGRSRIVIDLRAPAQIVQADCGNAAEGAGGHKLVIALSKTDDVTFRDAAQAARARLAAFGEARESSKPEPASGLPVVVLDPGHGGIDRGARVKGIMEKDITLEFAKALAAKLEARGLFKIIMTRADDRFVSLSERVRIGRENNASLFVSIHADTLSKAAKVSGATVYTLSDRASDAESARVAERENRSDVMAGADQSDDNDEVTGILNDLTRRETRSYSHMFARTLVNYWRAAGRLNKNPRRSARFRVLRAPDVPSALLELGYLSNGKDSEALKSPEWQDHAANQMADAISDYFASKAKTAPFSPLTAADPGPAAQKNPALRQ